MAKEYKDKDVVLITKEAATCEGCHFYKYNECKAPLTYDEIPACAHNIFIEKPKP